MPKIGINLMFAGQMPESEWAECSRTLRVYQKLTTSVETLPKGQ